VIAAFSGADWLALLVHFLSLSLLAIGGAITTAPEMHSYLVNEKSWLTDSQFTSSIALAQAAPGPNVLFIALLGWNVGMNAGGGGRCRAAGLVDGLGRRGHCHGGHTVAQHYTDLCRCALGPSQPRTTGGSCLQAGHGTYCGRVIGGNRLDTRVQPRRTSGALAPVVAQCCHHRAGLANPYSPVVAAGRRCGIGRFGLSLSRGRDPKQVLAGVLEENVVAGVVTDFEIDLLFTGIGDEIQVFVQHTVAKPVGPRLVIVGPHGGAELVDLDKPSHQFFASVDFHHAVGSGPVLDVAANLVLLLLGAGCKKKYGCSPRGYCVNSS
jgi:hypothetical protein